MTNLLRLLLLLLMGGSLLAARWADGLGERSLAKAAPHSPVRAVAQAQPYALPSGGWQSWGRLVNQRSTSARPAGISAL